MIDEKSRSVTSLFMLLAVMVMGALAYSVSQRTADTHEEVTTSGAALALADWLGRSLPEFVPDQIRRVTIRYPTGETLTIGRENRSDPVFMLSDTEAEGALDIALLETVAEFPASQDLMVSAPVSGRFLTFEGLAVEIEIYKTADKVLLRVEASAPDTDSESTAQAINARTGDRLYLVTGYRLDRLQP